MITSSKCRPRNDAGRFRVTIHLPDQLCRVCNRAGNRARRPYRVGARWDDAKLETALFPAAEPATPAQKAPPDFAAMHEQLRRHRNVTLRLLCELYQRWRRKLDVVMRQEHKAGEKAFVDWAGDSIPIHDPATGAVWQAPLFVAALGASSYTWAEATRDQQMESWLRAHVHAFDYWKGVPALVVPAGRISRGIKPS